MRAKLQEKWSAERLHHGETKFTVRFPDSSKVDCHLPPSSSSKVIPFTVLFVLCAFFFFFAFRFCMRLHSHLDLLIKNLACSQSLHASRSLSQLLSGI